MQTGNGPRYLRLADFIEGAVAEGVLSPGDRVPAQRSLAALLAVDLTTVTRGFNEARRRGLIEARGPLGTFIAAPRAELLQRVDLSMNIPPPPVGLEMDALLREGMSRVLLRSDAELLMTYHMGGGGRADWEAGAKWLQPMLGHVATERMLVCPGAQAALAALIVAFTRPGDAILAEPLLYPGLPHAAAQLGRRIEPVAVDAQGMRPDALEAACREHEARLIYLNPTLQNPTTATMPEARRVEILSVAERCGARIVEDDPYWRFAPDAPPPLARLAPAQVCYLATLSKTLSPGLRTAYLALPDAPARARLLAALRTFSLMAAPLTNALATHWIEEGVAEQIFLGVKAEARERQRIAAHMLGSSAGAGIHLWYALPRYWQARELAAAASTEGLAVAPSTAFQQGPETANAIRISLGATGGREQLQAALRKLSALLANDRSAPAQVIV
ncbi:aminotransferase-like domain-containing protein [Paraburkholderia lycopersici]|uniref:DNA-binding transcriptional regulator, MocR family, contains an aminotransferase domain n=1 Tax=Paraburkholderia lycopersici TaxID=416944 RepID=A0A1G6RCN8_9BURK|nr:PLP-dependent aminotransferase family protein [Paraburkholderia lycopersici]SDD02402.1 DNA-binding transcriptional regulator, MocR family, contains an aminotransferase domain [Paraburkholderia lycopersici]